MTVAKQVSTLNVDKDDNPADRKVVMAIKTNSSCFPKDEIIEMMKDATSGSKVVFECKSPTTCSNLVAIRYKYNLSKVFLATKNA